MIKELILSGILTSGDHFSTQYALNNGATETSPLVSQHYKLSKAIQFSAIAGAGMTIKSKKGKIIYWSAITIAQGIIIHHNIKVGNRLK